MSERASNLPGYAVSAARVMLLFFLTLALLVFAIKALITVTVPFSLDYGEGPLLDQAMRLAAGQPLYPSDLSKPPYTITNYPPLFVAMLAPFAALGDPSLLPGRLITTLATLATAFFLGRMTRHLTGSRLAQWVTAVLFLTTPWVVQWSGLVRVDMPALALTTGALTLLLRRPEVRRYRLLAGVLLVAAIYTRQSYGLAAPLAAFAWLWRHDRRWARELAILVAALGAGLFLLLTLLTGGGFWTHIVVANVNPFSWPNLQRWLIEVPAIAPVALALGLVFALFGRRRPGWPLVTAYLIGAVLSALTIGKVGSNVNYLLELAAALALVAGLAFAWSRPRPWLHALLLVALALQCGNFIRVALDGPVVGLTFQRNNAADLADLQATVAAIDGPVLADEHMALIPLAGKALYLQPFERTQLVDAGRWDQSRLLADIEAQRFPLILVYLNPFDNYPVHEDRWTPEMLAAIDEHYRQTRMLAGNIVYLPKTAGDVAETAVPEANPTFQADVQVGTPVILDRELSLLLPAVAVNPLNPAQLAATYTTYADLGCTALDCRLAQRWFTSTDGGASWQGREAIAPGSFDVRNGEVAFAPDGTLFALGLRDGRPLLNHSAAAPYELDPAAASPVNISRNPLAPELTIPDPATLFLTYAGRFRNQLGVRLNRSDDGGVTWSASVGVDEGVPLDGLNSLRATPPLDAQLLLGPDDEIALIWRAESGYWQWPMGVWFASSTDGGASFSEPRRVATTWGPIRSVAVDGRYHFLYQTDDGDIRRLALAISDDGGQNWRSAIVSGDQLLGGDFSIYPGLAAAADGTLDIAFFAPTPISRDCRYDRESWLASLNDGSLEDCPRDLYYTFSRDGGSTFAEPIKLAAVATLDNSTPFVEAQVAVASADEAAVIIWNDSSQFDLGPLPTVIRITR